MAGIGNSLQIGRSALAAYQAAISIVGQNIANVGNPDYTRQTGRMMPISGNRGVDGPAGGVGAGVQLSALERHMDVALEERLRDANSTRAAAETRYGYLSQIETLYNELSDSDLSTLLSELYGAFGALQSDSEDAGLRDIALAAADAVVRTIHQQRDGLAQLIGQMNNAAELAVEQVNSLCGEIAELNEMIVEQESDGQQSASALRDRRDTLLRDLSDLMDVNVRYQENGTANVYAGSSALVEFNRPRTLEVDRDFHEGFEVAEVRFTDDRSIAVFSAGELAGIVNTRDEQIVDQIERLDQLANGVIYETNRVHSTGVGLVGRTQAHGTYDVLDADAVLNSDAAGLPFAVSNGTFIVNVRNELSGETITRQIEVDLDGIGQAVQVQDPVTGALVWQGGDTTLRSLAAALDAVDGLSASVSSDLCLDIEADAGAEFWFSDDSSGALAALGINSLFEGTNAANIEVSDEVVADARLVAASMNGQIGDGDNAGRLSVLGGESSALYGNMSAEDFHDRMIGDLAVQTAAALTEHEASSAVHAGLNAQREAISGVSLDEEAIRLSTYERSFQGASRFLNVVNDLTDELLGLLN